MSRRRDRIQAHEFQMHPVYTEQFPNDAIVHHFNYKWSFRLIEAVTDEGAPDWQVEVAALIACMRARLRYVDDAKETIRLTEPRWSRKFKAALLEQRLGEGK